MGDITYIPTWQGWLYLATVIDCHTRAVIGYAMADHYKTSLISAAIDAAAANYELSDDAVFHSDRGSNYTSGEFADKLASLGIAQSVGRTGICYDCDDPGAAASDGLTLVTTDRGVLALTCRPSGAAAPMTARRSSGQ